MRIYVIGPPGSGKTTLAECLAKKHRIKCYELDLIFYDNEISHEKRPDEEREKIFKNILKKKSWIIEDVGRVKFEEGREKADIIYYIDIPRIIVYKRLVIRWVKQKTGKARYNYPPTLFSLFSILKMTHGYIKHQKRRKESLSKYKDKVVYLNYKELNELES
jgi:adenylate kinase family enzyme